VKKKATVRQATVIEAKPKQAMLADTLTRGNTEHKIQSALIKWANLMRHNYPELDMLFAIPNGGWRGKTSGGKMAMEGAKAGVPDLFLAVPLHGKHGLFIEMKAPKGVVSEKQKIWLKKLSEQGYVCAICYGLDQAIGMIESYLCINGKTFNGK